MAQFAPTSQKDRPIAFALLEAGSPLGAPLALPVRPEDLTLVEPFRVTAHNTLGGAYVDAFGAGIGSLVLAGTTGWRGGEEAFKRVRAEFALWARLREARVAAGLSPDDIELGYIDNLNDRSLRVVPQQFVLRRNRNDPLLLRYHVQCAVIGDLSAGSTGIDGILGALGNVAASVESLLSGVAQMTGLAGALSGMGKWLGGMAKYGAQFIKTASSVISRVAAGIKSAYGFVSDTLRPFYELAVQISRAGRNLFAALANIAGLPAAVVAKINAVIGGFTSFWCSLVNGVNRFGNIFDVSVLFGASNCSSTSGGAPISRFLDTNTFDALAPAASGGIVQTETSRRLTAETASMDAQKATLTLDAAADRARQITEGVMVE